MMTFLFRDKHDQNLREELKKKSLTLNKEKFQFLLDKILFFGITVSKDGVSPDEFTIEAVKNMEAQVNIFETFKTLQRCVINNFQNISDPLRGILRKKVKVEHSGVFEKLKTESRNANTMTL